MAKSIHLKEEGNRRYQAGDYAMAEALYSQAYASPLLSLAPDSSPAS
jgi:STIP1 family protein 1